MMRRSTLLTGENIWKDYPMGKNQTLQVLKGVDIEIRHGEFVVIVGPSGSGKSTLLHILGGLDRPTDGVVKLGEQNVFAHTEEQLAIFRNRSLGFVFQFHHLLPEFSALEKLSRKQLHAPISSWNKSDCRTVLVTNPMNYPAGNNSGSQSHGRS